MSHPFGGTPQYEQVYGNRQGPPLGRDGNGLGQIGSRPSDEPMFDWEPEASVEALLASLTASEGVTEGITLDDLYEGLGRLTARQTFVLRLLYGLDGCGAYSHVEIANLMGIARTTVYSHEEDALRVLRGLLVA